MVALLQSHRRTIQRGVSQEEQISRKIVTSIDRYVGAIDPDTGEVEDQQFYMRRVEGDQTVLETIVTRNLIMEDVLDIIVKRELERSEDEDPRSARSRVVAEIRRAVPPCAGLASSLASVRRRFPWSRGRLVLLLAATVLAHILCGCGLLASDLVTDVIFSLIMFKQFARNFTADLNTCTGQFDGQFEAAIAACRSNFTSKEDCLDSLHLATETADECFRDGNRFNDPGTWFAIAIIATIHCALPVIFSICVWGLLEGGGIYRKLSILRIPIPFVTLLYKVYCDFKLFFMHTRQEKCDEKSRGDYETEMKILKTKCENHDNLVTLSLLVHAGCQSSFQLLLQAVFLFPAFCSLLFSDGPGGIRWSDLVNINGFSILFSFSSLSWATLKTRYIEIRKYKC